MNDFSHGGNLKSLAADARRPERDILDFSVNLRPEGPPEFITSALWRAMNGVTPYPSPDMQELREKPPCTTVCFRNASSSETGPTS